MISHQLHQSDLHSRGQDYTALKYSGVGILGTTLEFFFWQPRSSLWISMSWSLKNPRGKKSGWLSSHLFAKFVWPQWKLYFNTTPSLTLKLVLCFIYVLGYTGTGKKKKKNLDHSQSRIQISIMSLPCGSSLGLFPELTVTWQNGCRRAVYLLLKAEDSGLKVNNTVGDA